MNKTLLAWIKYLTSPVVMVGATIYLNSYMNKIYYHLLTIEQRMERLEYRIEKVEEKLVDLEVASKVQERFIMIRFQGKTEGEKE